VHGYLLFISDANLTAHILVYMSKESKCVGIYILSLIVNEIKLSIVFIFNSAKQQCNDFTWKM
jgi:hypothetical protein